jgi:hypothetical protein
MPQSRLVNPATLVRGAAETLKIAIDLLPVPGKMLVGRGIDVATAVATGKLDRARYQRERREALGGFEAAISQTNATVIRTQTWIRRVIHHDQRAAAAQVVRVTPSLAKEYREIRRRVLEDLDDVESATLNLSPYLNDVDRRLLDRDIASLRAIVHEVLCPEGGETQLPVQEAERRVERLRSVGGRLQAAVEGLSH